jgi:hypothetical protein
MPTLKQCDRSLDALQRLFKNFPLELKLPSAVIGITGEIMVWRKLHEYSFSFVPIGGQAGYDILLDKISRNRIEVRTARPQIHKDGTRVWGWSAQKWGKRKKDGVLYDFLVCVALGDDLHIDNAKLFLFTSTQIMNTPEIRISRFRNVRRRISLYESNATFLFDSKKEPSHFSQLDLQLNQNPIDFTDWQLLNT